MASHWNVEIVDRVATVSINNPPANALSQAVLGELSELLDQWENNEEVKVIVLTGAGRFFIAGADIKEFTQLNRDNAEVMAHSGLAGPLLK